MPLATAPTRASTDPQPSSADWPIAAALLQFPSTTGDGTPFSRATPEQWHSALSSLRYEGFRHFELPNRWIDLTLLSSRRIEELSSVCDALGLSVPGYLVAGTSILDGTSETVDYTLRSIELAAELGATTVCLGLHPAIGSIPGGPEWFWNGTALTVDDDPAVRTRAVSLYRSFAERAASVGIQASLEMFPGTYVGTADSAVAFITDVGHEAMGLNPDLGNLVRVQEAVEDWQDVAAKTLPLTNYWHVKNYMRSELPDSGIFVTHPTSLELGVVNYRTAVEIAIDNGFSGTIVAEHYGGDGLAVSATNREYLRRLLQSSLREAIES